MMVVNYPSKKELATHVGKRLDYTETSMFGLEFKENGSFCVCNRPYLSGYGSNRGKREFFATVTMKDGLIEKVK
ncbi:MAG TPA: hypothetical protein VLG09_03830 [Candidatus Saccharimonadales bacterium]|nr:hypothetical protein [Candidatus Saccharimonadales bacterium]